MIRNESKILERCLNALVGTVDLFCIHDTGSTDTTRDIAREFLQEHTGSLTTSEWKNFGFNRTKSFEAAKQLVIDLKWNLEETYGLLLDADMVFVSGTLKQEKLTEKGYSLIQTNGNLEYPNCRLVRMDYDWKCVGVTHEYWDGPTVALPKSVACIEDKNDGGCKSDKFERDVKLLEKGLEEEPNNVRYMFYLAQTYHSLGRHRDSIAMYKKRIASGGWFEEIWYSHYMIGKTYLSIGDPIRAESWLLRAYKYRPERIESIYVLTRYFREIGDHYKAYSYMKKGIHAQISNDSLFIEKDVYTELFHYERSILEYYVNKDKNDGLRASVDYLTRSTSLAPSVLSNIEFYVSPIGDAYPITNLPSPFGPEFKPSAISIRNYPFANVRYINYWIENGEYKTPPEKCVLTENAYVNLDTGEVVTKMLDSSIQLERRNVHVKGLEDVRLYGKDRFTATVLEYSDGPRVLDGRYNSESGNYEDYTILKSPENRYCEKNWLPIEESGNFIYDWFPFRIIGPNPKIVSTPPIFSLFRGSAPPIRVDNEWWVLVHIAHYSKPRKYYHCLVVLNDVYTPIRFSLPFVFKSIGIEYCISFRSIGETLECYTSTFDSNPAKIIIQKSRLYWISI